MAGYYGGDYGGGGSTQTPYMNMLLSLDKIPRLHNILISVFTWILLAGFVIAPGSFTSAKRAQEEAVGGGGAGIAIALNPELAALTRSNTAAMAVGFAFIAVGALGSAWLALRWRRNYVWLLNKVYLPLLLNAVAGMIATVTSVYTQQVGEWSTQAYIAAIIEATVLGVSLMLFFVYNYWLLQRVRADHEETLRGPTQTWPRGRKKKKGLAGLLARLRRVRRKPPIAAGSVV